MRNPHPQLLKLATIAFLTVLVCPLSAEANQFRIIAVSRDIWPFDEGTVRVLGEAWARYDGAVDYGDRFWSINAHVRDNSFGGYQIGVGATDNGAGIVSGMTIYCSPYTCGADKLVARCDLFGYSNSFSVKGVCATFQPASPEFHAAVRAPETVLCINIEPPKPPEENCPIIIDLDGNGFHFSGPEDPVLFDIDADGVLEQLSWTDGSQLDGFLVLDINRNGRIDGGNELFGNHSWMLNGARADEGFQALGEYDTFTAGGTQDGVIDRDDLVYDALRVWIDENHDGRSDPGELLTLEELGIASVDLDYVENRRRDGHGNELRYNSRAWLSDGRSHVKTTDVFFVVTEIEEE